MLVHVHERLRFPIIIGLHQEKFQDLSKKKFHDACHSPITLHLVDEIRYGVNVRKLRRIVTLVEISFPQTSR